MNLVKFGGEQLSTYSTLQRLRMTRIDLCHRKQFELSTRTSEENRTHRMPITPVDKSRISSSSFIFFEFTF